MGQVPAICLPGYDSPDANGNCPQSDTSAVPMFFVGEANVQLTLNTAGKNPFNIQMNQVPMMFESAYFDSFRYLYSWERPISALLSHVLPPQSQL